MTTEELSKKLQEENAQLQQRINSLQSSENRYKRLFAASPDIIFELDKKYQVVVCHIPGSTIEYTNNYIGRNIFDISPAVFHDEFRAAFLEVLETGKSTEYETHGEIKGILRYYDNHLSAICDQEGNVTSVYFITRDVTRQKSAELVTIENEKKLKAVFDSSRHLHILLGKDARCIWFNQKADIATLLLYGKELVVGKHDYEYIPPHILPSFREYFQRCLNGETVTYEREYTTQEGNIIFLEITLQPVYSKGEELIGVSMISIDVTERRSYEDKLKKINKELVQQNMQLNQYSYIISHNLRGPIVTLLGLTEVFEQYSEDTELQKQVIGYIKKSTVHLDNIIRDLNLILSNSDEAELPKVNVDFEEEIAIVKDLLKSQIENAQAKIYTDFKEASSIVSVKSYIQSILLNLMSNSLKYKNIKQPAVISIKTTKADEHTVCISFEDNGLGFDIERNKDKLFGFYKRFHTHVEGKGLGLYLLKNQVDILKGKIEVESRIGEGTTFKIYLGVN